MYSYVAASTDPSGRPRQYEQFFSFEDIQGIWNSSGKVLVNGKPFIRFKDETVAAHYAEFLTSVWQLPMSQREAAIEAELAKATDRVAIEEHFAAYRDESSGLRFTCHAIFALLFIVLPASAWIWQIRTHWPAYAAALLMCVIWTAITFFRAHARLLPAATVARWKATAVMILMPTSAVRACDALSRHLLPIQHPLAVAGVLCADDLFRAFARGTLLDLKSPVQPVCPSEESQRQETEQRFRGKLQNALNSLVQHQSLDIHGLLGPLERNEPECAAFCPRCDMQYRVADGTCQDCGGIPLRRFEAGPSEIKAFPLSSGCRSS
jgi:hypothetical protein